MLINRTHRSWVPEQLIKKSVEQNWVKSLSFFVKARKAFSHGGFPSVEVLSQRTGMGQSLCYRHLKTLKSVGLIQKNDQNWYKFTTRKTLSEKYGKHCSTVIHTTSESITNIAYSLRGKLIEKCDRQQKHHTKDFKLTEFQGAEALKAVKNLSKKEGGSFEEAKTRRLGRIKYEELLYNTGFTFEYLADKLNCSKGTVSNIFKKLRREKRAKTKLLVQFISKMSLKDYNQQKNELRKEFPSVFWDKNSIYFKVCTLYCQEEYWNKEKIMA
jgi:predicted transcriptional regulator